jgi:DNA ligase-1
MNDHDILVRLEAIRTCRKQDEKHNKIEKLLSKDKARRIVQWAMDPFVHFGIHSRFEVEPGKGEWSDTTNDVLRRMALRDVAGQSAYALLSHELMRVGPSTQELIWRVLNKNLKWGTGVGTVNKIRPGTLRSFNPMLSHKLAQRYIKQWPVCVEPKYDGVRALILVMGEGVKVVSRNGKPLPGAEYIARDVQKAADEGRIPLSTELVLDGELDTPSGFNVTVGGSRTHKPNEELQFRAFDMLPADAFFAGGTDKPLTERMGLRDFVVKALGTPRVKAVPHKWLHSIDEIMEEFDRIRSYGGEGVMVKRQGGGYECRRSFNWLKVKDQETIDLTLVEVEEGTNFHQGMVGSVVGEDTDGRRYKVGIGLTDEMRKAWWDDPPYGLVFEVEYHERTRKGDLRHARIKNIRDDKVGE